MFGLENKTGKDKNGGDYDLEKELKDPAKASQWKKMIDGRIEGIRNHIRQGENPENFLQLETLLQGYLSLKKIGNRIK
ncbi:MAG: DUF5398 family protein [Parachlamydiales bacterium]|nr:DUF5398 family protein [Parachlamydiales bacterium]